MFHKCFFSILCAFFLIYQVHAELQEWEKLIPNKQTLTSITLYGGDQYGDFKGDLVAHLSDGSSWKIHPDDSQTFSSWHTDDMIHVGYRTSFYFFKREHKFELVNHTKQETVRAMIVGYPSLKIVMAEVILESQTLIPYTYGKDGNVTTVYYPEKKYVKKLTLSDGSIYTLSDNFDYYGIGDNVYIGINASRLSFDFALFVGFERYSFWTTARKIN